VAAADPDFVMLVRSRSDALVRTARLLTGNWQSAEDLVQTALMRTWQRWDQLTDLMAAEAYTRQVMVRLSATWWRRRWRAEIPAETVPEVRDPSDLSHAVCMRADVAAALATLPARQRATVVLRFYDDLSELQTAAALGCSVGTVKSNSARGLAKLRALSVLEPHWPDGAARTEVAP
jgi:RNA polymerase sigma-70 factor, ECF subfamily